MVKTDHAAVGILVKTNGSQARRNPVAETLRPLARCNQKHGKNGRGNSGMRIREAISCLVTGTQRQLACIINAQNRCCPGKAICVLIGGLITAFCRLGGVHIYIPQVPAHFPLSAISNIVVSPLLIATPAGFPSRLGAPDGGT